MMKHTILFIFLSLSLFSQTVEIQKVENEKIFFQHQNGLKIGMTGIVIHKVSEKYESIIAYVSILENGVGQIFQFTTLAQENLPHGKWKPESGDKIRFHENYERSVLLTRNFDSYIKTTRQKDENWIHPDIFAVTLNSLGHQSPLLGDFQYFCREHSIGKIYIQFDTELKVVDCLSMREIDSFPLTFEGETEKPFYSRVKDIDANWFGEGKEEIEDFEAYYKSLLEREF
jgi:hypothetical protein